jgi:hypothetical protein
MSGGDRGADVVPFQRPDDSGRGPFRPRYVGWYVAAAMLVLALWAGWKRTGEQPASVPVPSPTARSQRASLIEQAPDVIQVAWSASELEAYSGVTGDVVWSTSRQTGFAHFRGLPANRTAEAQYQLWILDPSRDEHPVDGGVFDVPAGVDDLIVPIDAELRIDTPTAFAVTLEKPGGVVVSAGPMLLVAGV